jgi:hypothetical protein
MPRGDVDLGAFAVTTSQCMDLIAAQQGDVLTLIRHFV